MEVGFSTWFSNGRVTNPTSNPNSSLVCNIIGVGHFVFNKPFSVFQTAQTRLLSAEPDAPVGCREYGEHIVGRVPRGHVDGRPRPAVVIGRAVLGPDPQESIPVESDAFNDVLRQAVPVGVDVKRRPSRETGIRFAPKCAGRNNE